MLGGVRGRGLAASSYSIMYENRRLSRWFQKGYAYE